ncbi:MAG: hypothetical protein JWN70_893 [Planctomycetaceae bacterium]|nr:hypothetical protein [Planctomycetaceae bacterium]
MGREWHLTNRSGVRLPKFAPCMVMLMSRLAWPDLIIEHMTPDQCRDWLAPSTKMFVFATR